MKNYASSTFGDRFYSEDYLQGISEQKNKIHAKSAKAVSALFLITTILAFYDSIEGTTKLGAVTVSLPDAGAAALCVLVSLNFLATLFAFLDQLIIDRYISVLGERVGVFSFELPLLNYSAMNLWSNAIQPKYFGLASERGHKSVAPTLGVFFLVLILAGIAYPYTVVGFTVWRIITSDVASFELILCGFSLILLALSASTLLAFCLNYKFRPTGSSEPDDPFVPDDFLDLGHPRRSARDQEVDLESQHKQA
ncbi:hypothetical protein [uncultured Roseovarius sp.]|uniref:hypothetical protein n=1 Tax=uncultured Roseovarius sp. TaxID=293344 RepID=UPI00261C3A52|nr:hypothetical protein [uncultured Roseovarius sp.]